MTMSAMEDRHRLAELTEGMAVSVDMSTGDDDAYDRVFARVTGAQQDSTTGGLMLLAEVEHDSRPVSVALRELAEWLVSLDDPDDAAGMAQRRTVTLDQIITRARKALGKE